MGGLDQQMLLLCDHGCSSSLAAATLIDLGFDRAGDVIGGFAAWRDAGLPTVPAPPFQRQPGHPPEWDSQSSRRQRKAVAFGLAVSAPVVRQSPAICGRPNTLTDVHRLKLRAARPLQLSEGLHCAAKRLVQAEREGLEPAGLAPRTVFETALRGKDGKVRRSLGIGRVRSRGRSACKQTV
jgi:hypothetical protein